MVAGEGTDLARRSVAFVKSARASQEIPGNRVVTGTVSPEQVSGWESCYVEKGNVTHLLCVL